MFLCHASLQDLKFFMLGVSALLLDTSLLQQEDHIFRLLEELDSFEAEFFDLGFKVKEMKKTKDEVIPDLQNELEKARYVNEAGER